MSNLLRDDKKNRSLTSDQLSVGAKLPAGVRTVLTDESQSGHQFSRHCLILPVTEPHQQLPSLLRQAQLEQFLSGRLTDSQIPQTAQHCVKHLQNISRI